MENIASRKPPVHRLPLTFAQLNAKDTALVGQQKRRRPRVPAALPGTALRAHTRVPPPFLSHDGKLLSRARSAREWHAHAHPGLQR
jgi:hypothetical protein